MNPAQTATGSQKSASGTSPFDQITALEEQEKARVEKEISAMAKEKNEVSASLQKKEDEASEEYREKAKKDLKEYSEKELTKIINAAKKDAEQEGGKLEKEYAKFEASVVKELVQKAKDPTALFA